MSYFVIDFLVREKIIEKDEADKLYIMLSSDQHEMKRNLTN